MNPDEIAKHTALVIEALRKRAESSRSNAFVCHMLTESAVVAAVVSAYLASVDRAVEACERAGLKEQAGPDNSGGDW